jgi:catechol 2,3-dioxygenase-like lactoylglutathione lyase family enzyme
VKQRLSVIALGTGDLERARGFYEALGWTTGAEPGDDVVFLQAGEIDGHPWEVAHNPHWGLTEDGGVKLAS